MAALDTARVMAECLWIILLQQTHMLLEHLLFVFFDGCLVGGFFLLLLLLFGPLPLSFLSVGVELLSPKSFDFSFVFLFFHSSLLGVELLDSLVFGELGSHLSLE